MDKQVEIIDGLGGGGGIERKLTLKARGELFSTICPTNTLTYCLPIFRG